MRKKVLSMMLAGMMLVTALTGCGNSEEKNNSVGEQSSEVKKETESSTEVQQATEELEEAAKIKWVIPSKALREDIEDAIVEYILEKVNVEVEFMYVGLGDYDQKLQVMNA